MERPSDYKFLSSHEWLKLDGDTAIIGISDFAVEALNDLTYVDLPDVGDSVSKGDSIGEIESVKAVSDFYAPVSGEIIAVNDSVEDDDFAAMKNDPFGAGWLVKIKVSDASEADSMLSLEAYEAQLENE